MVDTNLKKIFIKPCAPQCSSTSFEKEYDLTLICKDNNGAGLVGLASLKINLQSIYRPSFKIPNKIYYLLASGPNRVEIPELNIKVFFF
jgi:hypothetical protein